MIHYFLKPLKIILFVYVIGGLGLAADLAQLTNFNLIDFLKKNAADSLYFLVAGTFFLYILLVIVEVIRKESSTQESTSEHSSTQYIRTRDVKNSTIIQINKDKED